MGTSYDGELTLVTILDFGDRIEILVTSDGGCCLGRIIGDGLSRHQHLQLVTNLFRLQSVIFIDAAIFELINEPIKHHYLDFRLFQLLL